MNKPQALSEANVRVARRTMARRMGLLPVWSMLGLIPTARQVNVNLGRREHTGGGTPTLHREAR